MRTVLVTGATTPLGRALVRALLDDPAAGRVLAVGLEPEPDADLGPAHDGLHYVCADLSRPRAVHDLLHGPGRELEVRVVVHGSLHRSPLDRGRRVHAVNVESTRALLQEAERHPTIERFVFRSHCEIYATRPDQPTLFGEEHPINFSPRAPQWLRDRVEADLTVCTRMGLAQLQIAIVRAAECVGPRIGSQLFDYLRSRVCLRPMGYDPMLNLISIPDLVEALRLAVTSDAQGVFNIAGADTLPLSALVRAAQRWGIPVPGPLLSPLYRLRQLTRGTAFRYDLNAYRFHFSGVPDDRRARRVLGYQARHPLDLGQVPRL
ncbi:MAG: NAD-dependent epimerase/dehydratase family protein [Myxococcales bacterium]|nr:NAD-dependent epimerase/dehydratase family protein [Myxococcales bacterium]